MIQEESSEEISLSSEEMNKLSNIEKDLGNKALQQNVF